jgi:tetratricopeptide (TPR) repeat protein
MTAEPEAVDRLELAELLVTQYESAIENGTGRIDDLHQACAYAEAVIDEPESPRGWYARTVLAVAHEHLAMATGLPVHFDRAIETADELARWIGDADLLIDAARLRLFRYYALPGTVVQRFPSIEPAEDDLEHALANASSDEQRRAAETFLGIVASIRVIADDVPDPRTAARAVELLTANLPYLELTDPMREAVIRALADTHLLRHSDAFRGTADRDDELDLAVELYTEAVQDYGVDAAAELVRALVMRLFERPSPQDRELAIQWLETIVDCSDPAALDLEQAEQLAELLHDRAEDYQTVESANAAMSFLERAIDAVGLASLSLNMLLITACSLPGQATIGRLTRVIELIDVMVQDSSDSDRDLLNCLRALAVADRALRVALPADHVQARTALIEAMSGVSDYDPTHLAILASLALVIAAEQGTTGRPQGWSPYRSGATFPPDQRVAVLGWLDDHRPRPSAPGQPEYVAAIALLRCDAVPREPAPANERVAALEVAVAGLAEAAGIRGGDHRIHLLVRRELGVGLSELGRLTRSLSQVRQAAVVLNDALGDMPAGHPLRAGTLGYFANNILTTRLLGGVDQEFEHARTALLEAIDDPSAEPEVRAAFLAVLSSIEVTVQLSDRQEFGAALRYAQRAVLEVPDDHPVQALFRCHLAAVLMTRFTYIGGMQDLVVARQHLRVVLDQIRRGIANSPPTEDDVRHELRKVELLIAYQSGDPAELMAKADIVIAHTLPRLDSADTGPEDRYDVAWTLGMAMVMRADLTEQEADFDAAARQLIVALDAAPPALQRGMLPCLQAVLLGGLACLGQNREQFDQALAILDEQTGAGHILMLDRVTVLRFAAIMWFGWFGVTDDPVALDTAIEKLEQSDAELPATAEFRTAAGMYALSAQPYWRRGHPADVRRAVDLELTSLRDRGRDVVLQDSSDGALAIVADTAERSATLATRCLDLGLRADAVRAVEAGRGLVLQAATTTASIPVLLREHGYEALADEWVREEDGQGGPGLLGLTGRFGVNEIPRVAPSDLRQRVLSALAATDSTRVLLNIPAVHEIAAALRILAADAVVYLLPSADDGPGRALVVSSDGEISDITLPSLRDSDLGPLHDYVAARASAEDDDVLSDRREHLTSAWTGELDRLCDWAGQVVLGPLRSHLLSLGGGRTPHVVLVPSGLLSVVPWHAARMGTRRAVSDFVFSYASSARQLCALAARQHRPLAGSPVVVADPTGTLRWATVEAGYVQRCHPDSRYLGVRHDGGPADGAGTPDDVLAALLTDGASMVHFGCHAVSGATPSTSYLLLAGDTRLTVATIMAHRSADTTGGLVVLAACQSSLTQTAHDEGLTLANAFVAAGATGVTGALWAIPDRASSVLMCLYHHELSRSGTRPVDALRTVQLWALGDDRTVPDDFPAELLPYLADVDFRQPALWAAFTHRGW